jgi:hypothetical protein
LTGHRGLQTAGLQMLETDKAAVYLVGTLGR